MVICTKQRILVIFTLLLLSSCSSAPVGNLDKIAAMSHITQREQVLIRAESLLYPNTFEVTVSSITFGETVKGGNIVLTDKAIRFVSWREDAQQYVPVYEVNLDNITRIKSDTYLGTPYIAIQTSDYKFYSFFVYENKHQAFLYALQSRARRASY
jgi:hypothetical protein